VGNGTQGSRLPAAAAGHLKRLPEIRHLPVDSMSYKRGKAPELGGDQPVDRDHQTHLTYIGYMGMIVLTGSGRLYVLQMDYSTRRQKAANFSAVFPKCFCSGTRFGFEK